jgi:hypothetical protein
MDYKLGTDYRANECLTSDYKYKTTSELRYSNALFPCRLYIGDYYYDGEKWVHRMEYDRKVAKGYYAANVVDGYSDAMPTWYKYKDSSGDWVFTSKSVWDNITTEKESG